jgi:predicted TIM-barrel fold metal-dependent hydrolase
MTLFRIEDRDHQEAGFRVFNDWLIEYCQEAPNRLRGVGLIPLYDVDHGIVELERCRKAGIRGGNDLAEPAGGAALPLKPLRTARRHEKQLHVRLLPGK